MAEESAVASRMEFKKKTSRALTLAVKEPGLEGLAARASNAGLKLEQAWKAPRGEGFKAAAARLILDSEDVLIVAFRATFGNDEWLEYPQKYWKNRFIPHDGCPPGTDLKVFSVWSLTLDEVRDVPAVLIPAASPGVNTVYYFIFYTWWHWW